jgi:hypothetical protein
MTVFQDDPDMVQRIINAIRGTATNCFDAANSFTPFPRPEGHI